MKLQDMERTGSKVRQVYDKAKTPYERLLQCPSIPPESKKKLREKYEKLNPAELKRTCPLLQKKHLNQGNMKKFYAMVKDLRYNSKEAVNNVKNGRAVENELAEVLL